MTYRGNFDRWFMKNQRRIEEISGRPGSDHPAVRVSEQFRLLCTRINIRDSEAIELAIEFLKVDPPMPFGRTIKSQLARSLKKVATELGQEQVEFLQGYRDRLLALDHPPRETDEFVKLLAKIGQY